MVYIYQYFPGTVDQCTLIATVRDTLYSSQYIRFLAGFLGIFRGILAIINGFMVKVFNLCRSHISASKPVNPLKQAEVRCIHNLFLKRGYSNVLKQNLL